MAGIGDEQARRDGRSDRFADGRFVALRDGRHQALVDRSPGDGDHPEQSLAFVGQRGDLAGQGLGQRARQRSVATAPLDPDQFLHEEGVAARTSMDPVDLGVVGEATHDRGDLSGDVGAIEPLQVQAARPRIALEFGQPGHDRVAVRQSVGPDGQHEQQAVSFEVAGQEGHEVARPPIDPVQVLEDQQRRGVGTEVAEQPQHEPEQARLGETRTRVRGGIASAGSSRDDPSDPGQEPADLLAGRTQDGRDAFRWQVAQEGSQRFGQRRVRQAVVGQVQAATDEDARAIVLGAGDELLDQARLADAGLAGHDDDARLAVGCARERRAQRGELRRSPDELRTRDQANHRASLRAVRRFEVPVRP